tara:strand:- start:794 stop:1396 length:603 start_codon:yes stop_codon:yes gene_type:complete
MQLTFGSSVVTIKRGATTCTLEEFLSFQQFMINVNATPNKYRPSTCILRKQCAFLSGTASVKEYDFGQSQDTFPLEGCLPAPLRRVVDYIQTHYESKFDLFQCNYYSDGSVGISPHQDNESCLDHQQPILSFSFYLDQSESRPFSFYTLDDVKFMECSLGHGDLMIMSPEVQKEVKHGIEKERAKKYGPRINITARCIAK